MWQAWMFPREIQGDMYDDRHRKGVRGRRERGGKKGRGRKRKKERKREK